MKLLLEYVSGLVILLTAVWVVFFGAFVYNTFKEHPKGDESGPY